LRYYRPDTAESSALPDEQNIEAAASKLNLQPQPRVGSKTWARLIAKVYEVDPLKCESCGADMKLIAVIKDTISISKILTHLGEEVEAPKMQRARPPPEAYQVENEIEDYHEPEYDYDQSLNG
jgi:hypothetical protein